LIRKRSKESKKYTFRQHKGKKGRSEKRREYVVLLIGACEELGHHEQLWANLPKRVNHKLVRRKGEKEEKEGETNIPGGINEVLSDMQRRRVTIVETHSMKESRRLLDIAPHRVPQPWNLRWSRTEPKGMI